MTPLPREQRLCGVGWGEAIAPFCSAVGVGFGVGRAEAGSCLHSNPPDPEAPSSPRASCLHQCPLPGPLCLPPWTLCSCPQARWSGEEAGMGVRQSGTVDAAWTLCSGAARWGAGSSWLLRPQVPCCLCHACYPNPGSPGDILGVALLLFGGCVHLPFGLAPLPNTPQLASWEARSALLGAEYLLRVPGGECPQILLESGSLASLSPSDVRGSCCLNPTYR